MSFLREVLAQLFPKGEVQGSLGALAAFVGTLSLVFGLGALSGASSRANFDYMGAVTVCGVAALSLAGAYGAAKAGRRAPLVTEQYLGLAKFGRFVSWPAHIVSAVALVLGLVRVVEWRL